MLRHLFRFATAGAFGRAWARRSPFWFALGLVVMAFRFLDSRSAQRAKRPRA
jgi:hypothetical protein